MSLLKKKTRKRLFDLSRVIHVYTSTCLLGLMIFYCVTGIFLNHRWYDDANNQINVIERALSQQQMQDWGLVPQWQPNLMRIGLDLTSEFNLPAPHSIDLDEDGLEIMLDFKVPAGFSSVFISVAGAELAIESEPGSVIGILNDLHKGRHSGLVWKWVLDISAGLLIVFSLTGLIILYHGKRFQKSGTWGVVLGVLTPLVIYWLAVPQL